MNQHLKLVREFHEVFNYEQAAHGYLAIMPTPTRYARMSFIAEELSEILSCMASSDRVGQLDGAVDLAYFALGTLAIAGADVNPDAINPDALGELPELVSDACHCLNLLTASVGKGEGMEYVCLLLSRLYWSCIKFTQETIKADFDGAFLEVQRSNMSKLDKNGKPIYSPARKILKGSDFSEPVLEPFLYA